jgi:hypothetical protein
MKKRKKVFSVCHSHLKRSVVKSVVVSILEEVGVAVAVLQSVVDVVGYPLPVRDWPAMSSAQRWGLGIRV